MDEIMEMNNKRIVLVGAGNLATNFGKALKRGGHEIAQVYSRTEESAMTLAELLGCEFTTDLSQLVCDADVYVVSVKDSVLDEVVGKSVRGKEQSLWLHTAGSMPMDCFKGRVARYGVLYPMQTFSKGREVDFQQIPCFVEGSDSFACEMVAALARTVSGRVIEMSSSDRKYLHLAAVWACNFANHCYDVASMVLGERGIPFDVMLPLIDETARKVHELSPREAQTGPAVRYDRNVMDKHLSLMDGCRERKELYEYISKSIHERATGE